MKILKDLRHFLLSRESQKGQIFYLFAALTALVLLPLLGGYVLDRLRLRQEIHNRQMATDEACWNGAVTRAMGGDWTTYVQSTLDGQGYGSFYYSPQEGTQTNLTKGITWGIGTIKGIPVPVMRVAIWGPSQTMFHHFIGNDEEWESGGRTRCTSGLGGVLPILIKEYEDEPIGWAWGDTVVMFGDGWDPNVGPNQSPTGIGNPDIYCVNGGPSGDCSERIYRDPPAPDGVQVNTLKNIVMGYMQSGYDGPLPAVGTFIPRQAGLANHQTVQSFLISHNDGDYVAVMIIRDGDVYGGEKGFDNVEIIGYAIFQVDDHDANTVWGHPVTPILSPSELYQYPVDPQLLSWEG